MLTPYTITAIERDEATAESTGKQVIVGATCSMFELSSGSVVTLYDNASGANGSTAKTTGVSGQVTVYVEPGQYKQTVNSITSYVTVGESVALGTAATEDVTSNNTDTTSGRVITVPYHGLGALFQGGVPDIPDDATQIGVGFWRDGDGSSDFGFPSSVINIRYNNNRMSQIGIANSGGTSRMAFRAMLSNDTWSGACEVHHSENLTYAQNVSGSTVLSNGTVSGANLDPVKTGTWRNVSGGDIIDDAYGLWEIV